LFGGIQTHVGHDPLSLETGLLSVRKVKPLQLEERVRRMTAAQRLGISSEEMAEVCYHPEKRDKAVKPTVLTTLFR